MKFLLSEIAAAVDGTLVGEDVEVDGASIDSRQIQGPMLFVPIVAERDGHDFIEAAVANGAAAHLTSGPTYGYPEVRVEDTGSALRALAREARARLDAVVIGITGSVGKTTTKDLLAAALAADRPTHASYRSFNNELGVPLTLVNADASVEAVVLEMGARGPGHIAELCEVASPTVGVVVSVGAAHTELFGDIDGVVAAKSELIQSLPANGTAVLNAADPRIARMAEVTSARVLTFADGGDVTASDIRLDDSLRPSFVLHTPWGQRDARLTAAGVHAVTNACAAAAAALAVGADIDAVVTGLSAAEISPWRMEVSRLASGALVINDAYNANPLSMNAAIDALVAVEAERRVAVIGIMAELGAGASAEHRKIGNRLAAEGVDVIAVNVPEYGGVTVENVAAAATQLGSLDEQTAVLIKASRVAGLEALMSMLVDQ